jgi:triphosphoribosyl-dephospho-CoA synthase
VLDALDVEDANLAFQAIIAASPGGLGHAERHDVRAPATVSLKAAMEEAAQRDRVARQYVSVFEDLFGIGVVALRKAKSRAIGRAWETLSVYLAFLSAFPDTHVVRKHGPELADEVRRTAKSFFVRAEAGESNDLLRRDLLAWDSKLKERNINPGTSADLTVATLFFERLGDILPSAPKSD